MITRASNSYELLYTKLSNQPLQTEPDYIKAQSKPYQITSNQDQIAGDWSEMGDKEGPAMDFRIRANRSA